MMLVAGGRDTLHIQLKYNTNTVQYGTYMIQNTIERMRRRGHMMLVVGGRCGNRRPNKERAQVLLLLATDNHRSLYPICMYKHKYRHKYKYNTKQQVLFATVSHFRIVYFVLQTLCREAFMADIFSDIF